MLFFSLSNWFLLYFSIAFPHYHIVYHSLGIHTDGSKTPERETVGFVISELKIQKKLNSQLIYQILHVS